MTHQRWSDLSQRSRRVLIAAGAVEAMLKIAALVDLRRRHPEEVRGSRKTWAWVIVLVNSAGAVPIAYFVRGRKGVGG